MIIYHGDILRENLPLRGKARDHPWAPPSLKVEDKPEKQGKSEKSSGLLKQRKQNVLRKRWSSPSNPVEKPNLIKTEKCSWDLSTGRYSWQEPFDLERWEWRPDCHGVRVWEVRKEREGGSIDKLEKVWLWRGGERQGSSQEVRRLGGGRLGKARKSTELYKGHGIKL